MAGQDGRKKKFRSLSVNLALAFMGLCVIVLLISTSLNLFFSYQSQDKIIDSQQQLIAQDAADKVSGYISDKFSKLEDAANLGNLDDAPQAEQEVVLDGLIGIEPAFRQVLLLDAQGQELVYTSRLSSYATGQLTEVGSDLFSEASTEARFISSIYIDGITSEPMVITAVPITGTFGNFEGLLMAEANLKFMWDLVDSIEVGETGMAYVVDNEGNLIAFGDISRVLRGDNLNHLDEVNEFVEGSVQEYTSEVSVGIQGGDVVTTHIPLGSPDWAVVVELPVKEAYSDVMMQLMLSILVMLLCFVLAIVLGILLSKRITKPIVKLRDATGEISKGNLDMNIEVESRNEIGELAVSFNSMTSDLKESRQELEEKVKKRTAELTFSNEQLHKEVEDRMLAEVAAQDNLVFLESVMNGVTSAIFVFDITGGVMFINRGVSEITGYEESDIIGKSFSELFTPEEYSQVKLHFDETAIKGDPVLQYKTELIDKEGQKRTISLSLSALFKDERVVAVVGNAEDITEYMKMRERTTGVRDDESI